MDEKSFSAYVRSKTKCKVQVGPVLDNKGDLVAESDMVTAFNNYFVSVFILRIL